MKWYEARAQRNRYSFSWRRVQSVKRSTIFSREILGGSPIPVAPPAGKIYKGNMLIYGLRKVRLHWLDLPPPPPEDKLLPFYRGVDYRPADAKTCLYRCLCKPSDRKLDRGFSSLLALGFFFCFLKDEMRNIILLR